MEIIGAFALASMVSACFGFMLFAMMGSGKEYDIETEDMFRKLSEPPVQAPGCVGMNREVP